MFRISPLEWLAIAWAAVTVVFVVLAIRRSLLSMKEDDQLFIDTANSGRAAEQNEIQEKLRKMAPLVKGFGATSAALLLAIAGVWVYRLLTRFAGP